MKLNLKAKTIISVVLFVLVFVALVLVASFCDLQISKIMTNGTLDWQNGKYFADGFFGVMMECIGCIPLYLMIAFLMCVFFWTGLKVVKKKPLGIAIAVVCGIGVVAACWYALYDTMGYIFEHVNAADNFEHLEAFHSLKHSAAIMGIEIVFGLIMGVCAIFATKHFSPDTLKKLLKFALATVIAVGVANILIMIIKGPVGRMRFRAFNSTVGQNLIAGGQAKGFTNWYVANGKASAEVNNAFKDAYGVKDAFKSFPSGHTSSGATVYALIMIPTLFDFKNTKKKSVATAGSVLCWALPILYTALVAISRIMVGAHFMSDVTFGGTIVFVCVIIAWEIFICKGSHFFAVFPSAQKKKALATDAVDVPKDDAATNNENAVADSVDNVPKEQTNKDIGPASDDVPNEASDEITPDEPSEEPVAEETTPVEEPATEEPAPESAE